MDKMFMVKLISSHDHKTTHLVTPKYCLYPTNFMAFWSPFVVLSTYTKLEAGYPYA